MSVGLEPFTPSPQDPWDAAKAAHLLRRAGFGPLPSEIAEAVSAGPERAVASLFAFPPEPPFREFVSSVFDEVLEAEQRVDSLRRTLGGAREKDHPELRAAVEEANRAHGHAIMGVTVRWLDRMATTPAPLQEKLVLFWHAHFTSSFGEVHDAIAMFNQNQLFRRHAAEDFVRLLELVAQDPAMLRYLNNDENRSGHPNENWARELMELFTMGIGHYTETDVKESARAWTGWTLLDRRSFAGRRIFAFKPLAHDGGLKTFLGETGRLGGMDIMHIIRTHPATPQWIAGKLAQFFVAPQPDPSLVGAIAQELQANNYWIRPVLQALFGSRAFYQPEVMHAHVKSPTEFVVGAVRHLGIAEPDWVRLSQGMAAMGQRLFFPPTVAGWRGGPAWINAGTVFIRTDLAAALVAGRFGAPDTSNLSSLDAAVNRLIGRPLPSARRDILARVASGEVTGEVLHLIMSLPEYQAA
jgi:uncharacterized protein (DUF1800 family)